MASFVADWLGARRIPWDCSIRHMPTVRKSCQPMPGCDRLAGDPVPEDRRGTLIGDADRIDGPGVGKGRPGDIEHGCCHDAGVELDEALRR